MNGFWGRDTESVVFLVNGGQDAKVHTVGKVTNRKYNDSGTPKKLVIRRAAGKNEIRKR